MLSREENELVTRVGPGHPHGQHPAPLLDSRAAVAAKSPNPTAPRPASACSARTSSPSATPRAASACSTNSARTAARRCIFGRNEECGLRCVYHGWKFDVSGACIDMMNEPEENDFKHKVRLTAYPTAELGGIIWAYLGPVEHMPPLPKFAWTQAPESHRHVTKVIQECNWLQGLEGGIDTSHAPIMHRLLSETSTRGGFKPSNPFVRGKAPKLVVDITDYGYQYAGIRPLGDSEMHIRTYQFILPFHQIRPSKSETGLPLDAGHIWVPMDDENTAVYNWGYCPDGPLSEEDRLERGLGNGPMHVDPVTFRSKANRANNYMLDRLVQKDESYTGIDGINVQDRAIQESMGRDRRSFEGASRAGRQGDHPGAQAAARGGEDGGGRRQRRPAPAPATIRCARMRRCCRAMPTGAAR